MKRILTLLLSFIPAFSFAAQLDTLYLSTRYTTHIVFQGDLTYVDISNKAIAGKVIESKKNILALKARTPFDYTTTVSALESEGAMTTFIVAYKEEPQELVIDMRKGSIEEVPKVLHEVTPPDLSDVVNRRQQLFHIMDRRDGLTAMIEDIFVVNDRTFFVISIKNKSSISFDCADAGFMVESTRKSNRGFEYQKPLAQKGRYGSLSVEPGRTTRAAFSMDKVSLSKGQVLTVYLYENGGSRNLSLTLTRKDINKARKYR